jgi:membrane protease YdiL (CAAX protease family)
MTKDKQSTLSRINNLRAPLMMIFVGAFCGSQVIQIPTWILLLVLSGLFATLALVYERQSLSLMLKWQWKSAAIGAALALPLYGLLYQILQNLTLYTITPGDIYNNGALPSLIQMLIDIRVAANVLPAFGAGSLGALVLAPTEELFWRGFIQRRLVDWLGPVPGILISTTLGSLFWMVALSPLAAAGAFVCGLVFAIVSHRSGSLVPAIVCHSLLLLFGLWIWPLY